MTYRATAVSVYPSDQHATVMQPNCVYVSMCLCTCVRIYLSIYLCSYVYSTRVCSFTSVSLYPSILVCVCVYYCSTYDKAARVRACILVCVTVCSDTYMCVGLHPCILVSLYLVTVTCVSSILQTSLSKLTI